MPMQVIKASLLVHAERARSEASVASGAPTWAPRCSPALVIACTATQLSPAPWPGAQAGPCLPTSKIKVWLQVLLASILSSPKWETQPLFIVQAGKPSCLLALDALRAVFWE